MKNLPKVVYLQIGEYADKKEFKQTDFNDLAEVSWCSDSIEKYDVQYVRADLAFTDEDMMKFARVAAAGAYGEYRGLHSLEAKLERYKELKKYKYKRLKKPTKKQIKAARETHCSQDDHLGLRGRIFKPADFQAGVEWTIEEMNRLNKKK